MLGISNILCHLSSNSTGRKLYKIVRVKMHNEKISMHAICHSYLQGISTVQQPYECVTFPYGTALKYPSKNSDLSWEIKIRRCPNRSVSIALFKCFEQQSPTPSNITNTALSSAINNPVELRWGTRAPNRRATRPQPPPPLSHI